MMICKHANKLSAIVGVSQEIQVWNEWYLTFFFKGTDFELKKKKKQDASCTFSCCHLLCNKAVSLLSVLHTSLLHLTGTVRM